MEPAKKPAIDRGEPTQMMEPLCIAEGSPHLPELLDLAMELTAASAGLTRSLPADICASVAGLVRSMNCYYSNLIEGHNTHPIDIERALAGNYSSNVEQRNLQLEARAHITVQKWLESVEGTEAANPQELLFKTHKRFYDALPDELRRIQDPESGESHEVIGGEVRGRDVQVGRHVAISPGAIPRFLERYYSGYEYLSRTHRLVAIAASHHRLLWIHPFLDGNGRVARLTSQWSLDQLLQTGNLWSISRGLARNESTYKAHLMACDGPRRGDLDGRGNLSEGALANFTRFFLETCLDQVQFMERLVQPEQLRNRMLQWATQGIQQGNLPHKTDQLLNAILFKGRVMRGEIPSLLGISERQARRVTSALSYAGALTSEGHRSPFKLAFPAKLAPDWMPGLFPAA